MDFEKSGSETFDIKDIIRNKKLKAYFQPIVYISRKLIIGVEGLVRGTVDNSDQLISPLALFDAAEKENLTLELDRVCREKVIEAYSRIFGHDNEKLLFLNIEASIIEKVEGSNYLINQVKKHGINPENIVIEVNETKTKNVSALERFINNYRQLGFLIALDDIGSGFSNLDRISMAKPNIIKADMSLIRGIQKDFYKQEVFKALVSLASKIGAIVVAEGVESEEESIQVIKLGAQMIQGYYFSKPVEYISPKEENVFAHKIEKLNNNFKKLVSKAEKSEKAKLGRLFNIINTCAGALVKASCGEFDCELTEIVYGNRNIACVYILDEYGIQVSDTICLPEKSRETCIYYSAARGTDHSMKKYFYRLKNSRLKKYITGPYISLASGNLCITISKLFTNKENKRYILCMDFENVEFAAGEMFLS